MPQKIRPMLAVLSRLPRDPRLYAFEFKWDGIRALTYLDRGRMHIESRNLIDITHRYPELDDLPVRFGRRRAVFDGEIVAFDADGRPSFSALQERMHLADRRSAMLAADRIPIQYIIFDLLYLDGESLLDQAFIRRRALLSKVLEQNQICRLSPAHPGEGEAMLATAREHQLEGIVAKRLDSLYQPGRRSPAWLKIKILQRQEFVIGGWIPEKGTVLNRVGALLLGYHHDKTTRLRYAGSVGTGFTSLIHGDLTTRLKALEQTESPFTGRLPRKKIRFVRPSLVAEIEYRGWTRDNLLRQSAYKGLRPDKRPEEVTRESEI